MTLTQHEQELGFMELTNVERRRRYVYEGGETLEYHDVTAICVRPSGNHRLNCREGKIIVTPGWLALEIDADGWDF